MTLFSAYSPVTVDGRQGRRASCVAFGAGALALIVSISGCSAAAPLTPRMAISLAADKTQSVTSMAATFSDQISGAVAETTSGTLAMQTKPALIAETDATASADGQTFPIDEIVSTTAMYLKSSVFSVFTGQTGKPWIEIPFASLSGNLGASLTGLLQDVQNGDPLDQTKMLAASKNVRAVGTQEVNGVRTTHYAGSFTASAALASLPAALRKQVAPLLRMVSGDIQFNAWIDANHLLRRITETETVGGETVHSTISVTSVNGPVHVAPPSAADAVVLTKNDLGGM